jgi:DNA-binding winged helix-turn-helix (wHTH) protein
MQHQPDVPRDGAPGYAATTMVDLGRELDGRSTGAAIAVRLLVQLDEGQNMVAAQSLSSSPFQRPLGRARLLLLSFPPFQLDLADERLWKAGVELRLRHKPFVILRYLAEHPRRLVTQGELFDAVWGNVVLSESVLRAHIHAIRNVLGEGVIETVVGRGYRFLADVREVDPWAPHPPREAEASIGKEG